MTYLALVEGDDWSLGRDALVEALRRDWPASVIEEDGRGDPARDVAWSHGDGISEVEGTAHESGQCLYLDGQVRPVSEFVAWYRRLVPADRTVILCDDTYSFDAVVEAGSDPGRVLSLFPA